MGQVFELPDFFNFLKPKNELENQGEFAENHPYIPEELWIKCPVCKNAILSSDLMENHKVCPKCNYHFRIAARQRIEMTIDVKMNPSSRVRAASMEKKPLLR